MAETPEAHQSRLTPPPKVLAKALAQSAKQARRLAQAFGVAVPGVKPTKVAKPARKTG